MVQNQYWKELHQLKTHIGVIELHLEKAEKIDRGIKIFLAVASSGSIAGWAVWHQFSMVWAFIIAGSQVVTAIAPYLPYRARIKSYSALLNELEQTMQKAEFNWHSIAAGKLTETEINKERFVIRRAKQQALNKYVRTTIPTNNAYHAESEKASTNYFTTFYSN